MEIIGDFELNNNNPFKEKIYQYITLFTSVNYSNMHKTHSKVGQLDINDVNNEHYLDDETPTLISSFQDCVIAHIDKYYNPAEYIELFKINNIRISDKKNNTDRPILNTKKINTITLNKESKCIIDFMILGFLTELVNINDIKLNTKDTISNLIKTKMSEDSLSLTNFIITSVNQTKFSLDRINTYYLYNEFITHANFYFDNINATDLFARYMTDFIKLLSINMSNHVLFDKAPEINKRIILTILNNLSNMFGINNSKIFYNIEKYIDSIDNINKTNSEDFSIKDTSKGKLNVNLEEETINLDKLIETETVKNKKGGGREKKKAKPKDDKEKAKIKEEKEKEKAKIKEEKEKEKAKIKEEKAKEKERLKKEKRDNDDTESEEDNENNNENENDNNENDNNENENDNNENDNNENDNDDNEDNSDHQTSTTIVYDSDN
jgi:hypothetical protein